jgi:hypothetical protein
MSAAYLVLAVLIAAAAWLAHSWWWPWRRCPRCLKHSASGRGTGSSWRAYNRCHWCGGAGETVRIGARMISKATGKPPRGSKEK